MLARERHALGNGPSVGQFQVLIGSKRKQLGELPEDADKEVAQDDVEECESFGALKPRRRPSCWTCARNPRIDRIESAASVSGAAQSA